MRKQFFVVAIVLMALQACQSGAPTAEAPYRSDQSVFTTLDSLMLIQEKAWNNGDIPGFMSMYWNSDSLSFVGSNGLQKGWNRTLTNYLRSYPNSDAMGTLVFENKEYNRIATDAALVIGSWTLNRSTDTLSGYYTLLWQLKGNHWRITSDHSS